MNQNDEISDVKQFAEFADSCLELWKQIINLSVTHCKYGEAKVLKVEGTRITVSFDGRWELIVKRQEFIQLFNHLTPSLSTKLLYKLKEELTQESLDSQTQLRKEKHKIFLNSCKSSYKGTQVSSKSHHRITHCYNCKHELNNKFDLECVACRWIICNCGACGCGYTSY